MTFTEDAEKVQDALLRVRACRKAVEDSRDSLGKAEAVLAEARDTLFDRYPDLIPQIEPRHSSEPEEQDDGSGPPPDLGGPVEFRERP